MESARQHPRHWEFRVSVNDANPLSDFLRLALDGTLLTWQLRHKPSFSRLQTQTCSFHTLTLVIFLNLSLSSSFLYFHLVTHFWIAQKLSKTKRKADKHLPFLSYQLFVPNDSGCGLPQPTSLPASQQSGCLSPVGRAGEPP